MEGFLNEFMKYMLKVVLDMSLKQIRDTPQFLKFFDKLQKIGKMLGGKI